MSWQKRLIGVLAPGVLALWPHSSAVAGTVGIDPCDGLTMFVKEFSVAAGTTITGVAFQNNDSRTVFPEVVLVHGDGAALSDGTSLAQATDVGETAEGWVRVTWRSGVEVTEAGTYRVGVRFPEGPGKLGDGNGPGIGAVRVAAPTGSYVAGGSDGELTPMSLDLAIELLTGEARKAGTGQPVSASVLLRTFLAAAAPNPGRGPVRMDFGLERAGSVTLSIYDVSGRLVRVLARGTLGAGAHTRQWDGRDEAGRTLAAGVYIAKLQVADRSLTEKVVLAP